MITTEIPAQNCSRCGYLVEATTGVNNQERPNPGDISICMGCGHLTLFAENNARREPTSDEALTMSLLPEVITAQLMVANLKHK